MAPRSGVVPINRRSAVAVSIPAELGSISLESDSLTWKFRLLVSVSRIKLDSRALNT